MQPMTVNALLLEKGDKLLLDAIREKRMAGWSVVRIALYYNIFHNQTSKELGEIPEKLYRY